jgi:REP element-mobilizing transposase RayT
MSRSLRVEYEGALYHITSRGNEKRAIFLEESDYETFLIILSECVCRYRWLCHGYCLMPNHYHLLIETPEANLARGMKWLNGVYSQRFNRSHGRVGHVLQGRYKGILVEKQSHLLELTRYVVLNPVRAGLARTPSEWRWSSYRATAGEAAEPRFLTTCWLHSQFGATRNRAIEMYRSFVAERSEDTPWSDLRGGCLLGSDAFVKRMRPWLQDAPVDPNILRAERVAARPSLKTLFAEAHDRESRNRCIWNAFRVHHYRLTEIGSHLGLHFATVSKIARREASLLKAKKQAPTPLKRPREGSAP